MAHSLADIMLPEFDRELASTRELLSQVTSDSMSFKPADKLHTVGWNANHLLDIVGWTVPILEKSEFELAPVDGPPVMPSSLSDPDDTQQR